MSVSSLPFRIQTCDIALVVDLHEYRACKLWGELEVLHLLVGGKSNKDIAHAIGITEATVKSHVSTILERLQVSDRTQAVVTALQRGLVHL